MSRCLVSIIFRLLAQTKTINKKHIIISTLYYLTLFRESCRSTGVNLDKKNRNIGDLKRKKIKYV